MSKYVVPFLASAFLALGLGFRYADGISSLSLIEISCCVALVLGLLCALVRFAPNASSGMALPLFFVQAQIFGNLLLTGFTDQPNWHLYQFVALTTISWIIVIALKVRAKKA